MQQGAEILIVGTGHAGAQCAIALRQAGHAGSVMLVGEEPELPYERPPLSKEYLTGDKPFERMLLRPPAFWEERAVAFRLGEPVTAVDAPAKRVRLAGGGELSYGTLIWAAGGSPRRLTCSGHDLAGLHAVRTRADVDALLAELPDARHVVVVGAGYIGLEAAAALVKGGQDVTVLEMQDRVLARVAGVDLARFYEAEHRAHGVDIRLGVTVDCIEGEGGRVARVRLGDGTALPADMVIVGIGIVPSIGPLLAAGAAGDPAGVDVDELCRTSLPDIFAIGDCARHANAFAGGARIRLESVQNANDMGTCVARAITGQPQPYHAVPWFWSNQYDLKLQTVGLSLGHDATVLRGDPGARSFSVLYLREGRVLALDCVNAAKDYVQGRALVTAGARVDPARLADSGTPLKELAAQAA